MRERCSRHHYTTPSTRLPAPGTTFTKCPYSGRNIEHAFGYTSVVRKLHDWSAIQAYHDEGHGFVECQKRYGFTHGAWNKAISTGRLRTDSRPFADRRRRYDWAAIQAYYDEGHCYTECRRQFQFSVAAWTKAVRRGELTASARRKSLATILATSNSRRTIKTHLLAAGIMVNRCSRCGIGEWQGAPLSCHIDHINGIRDDHRLENLRMLCPNCHSQTETYGGKNVRRRRQRLLQESAGSL
jgi:hypothetical protein